MPSGTTGGGDGREAWPRAWAALERGRDERIHTGAQFFLMRDGAVLADLAWGEAEPGRALRPDTRVRWMSSTKPLLAVAWARHWERGAVGLDWPVARLLPAFGQGGKGGVTFRHILTHTSGFPRLEGPPPGADWRETLERACRQPLGPEWAPGKRACYHMHTSWAVLAGALEALSARDFEAELREAVLAPLGLGATGLSLEAGAFAASAAAGGLGNLWNTFGLQAGEPPRPWPWDRDAEGRECLLPSPGSSGLGPVRELGRFYASLLGHGPAVLGPITVEAMASPHRIGMFDELFRHVLDWGLGFLVDSNRYGSDTVPYGFGRHASPRAFGHGGYQSSAGFADPEHGLALAVWFNGTPGEPRHNRRIRDFCTAVYEDLGLA